jgi:hypothetical protein
VLSPCRSGFLVGTSGIAGTAGLLGHGEIECRVLARRKSPSSCTRGSAERFTGPSIDRVEPSSFGGLSWLLKQTWSVSWPSGSWMVADLRGTERELHAGFGGDMGVAFIRS